MFELLNQQIKSGQKEITGEFFQKLTASDGVAVDQFGISASVSADGSVIVVGAHTDDDNGTDSGSVYIFIKQANESYVQTQKLVAADGAASDLFGYSVSVSADGSAVVVGAYGGDDKGTDSGSAYIFTRQANGNYVQAQKLTASDGATGDYFGYPVSVSADGSVIVVGAYPDDGDKGYDSGSAYIFIRQVNGSYSQTQKLTASDEAVADRFGYSVSVSSDASVLVVGAYFDDDKGSNSGSAYVFNQQAGGSYSQFQKLIASDGAADDYFGRSVSTSADGSVIVVGSSSDDDKGRDSGSVYIFTKQVDGTYSQKQKLTASDGSIDDYFGISTSVSADGSVVVVGAYYGKDDRGIVTGSAYIFTKQTNGSYGQFQKLTAYDGAATGQFGYSVSVSDDGSAIVVGAHRNSGAVAGSGSAYIFK